MGHNWSWGLRNLSKGSFYPDWSLQLICWVLFSLEPSLKANMLEVMRRQGLRQSGRSTTLSLVGSKYVTHGNGVSHRERGGLSKWSWQDKWYKYQTGNGRHSKTYDQSYRSRSKIIERMERNIKAPSWDSWRSTSYIGQWAIQKGGWKSIPGLKEWLLKFWNT